MTSCTFYILSFILIVVCVPASLGCSATKQTSVSGDERRIDLTFSFPYGYVDGKFINHADTVAIFYTRSLEIFRFSITSNTSALDSILSTQILYRYMIRRPCDSVAYLQQKPYDTNLVKVRADSILDGFALNSSKLKPDSNRAEVQRLTMPDGSKTNIYVMVNNKRNTHVDSVYLHFDKKVNPFCYSLSPYYDATEKQKLMKVRMTVIPAETKPSSTNPAGEILIELTEKLIQPSTTLDTIIKSYNASISKK